MKFSLDRNTRCRIVENQTVKIHKIECDRLEKISTPWQHDWRLLRRRERHLSFEDRKLKRMKTSLTFSLEIKFGFSRLSSNLQKRVEFILECSDYRPPRPCLFCGRSIVELVISYKAGLLPCKIIPPFTEVAYQVSLVEPWFVFWRDLVEPKYPWQDQTSLMCCQSIPKRFD